MKSINNTLNSAHLLLSTEAILTLKKFGIDPVLALDAINDSSGRSLATQSRLPEHVLTRKFEYGFKYFLMLKDLHIAKSLINNTCNDARLLKSAIQLYDEASKSMNKQSDYTEAVKYIEDLEKESLCFMKTPIVYVGMAADIVHFGHINIIKHAVKYGKVIVGLLSDDAIRSYKREPITSYHNRKIVVENMIGVSEVISQDLSLIHI